MKLSHGKKLNILRHRKNIISVFLFEPELRIGNRGDLDSTSARLCREDSDEGL